MARTPSIGVGGTLLSGGFTWLSTEYGCISDPINFVEAEVVKYDGSVIMASQEPELLWALRGAGGGFGSECCNLLALYRPQLADKNLQL